MIKRHQYNCINVRVRHLAQGLCLKAGSKGKIKKKKILKISDINQTISITAHKQQQRSNIVKIN